ncbi:GyrI-like domain-containing protein [Streptomyces clavuligerus]|uniref:GyrI-like domain-containing protein n=1 Tax=Streptomyces clavuligerus TaxID=1901 RepID=UPI0018D10E88|nr:GyrI-like domain-containing protein [Streptomyces clavuligerus]
MSDFASLEPIVVEHGERPYAFIRGSVRMDAFATIADRLGELIGWVAAQGTEFAGPPFFRFNTVDLTGESEVEAGIPVVSLPTPEGDIHIGALPPGRYATARFTAHPDRLRSVATALRAWADRENLPFDMTRTDDGVEHCACRIESYLTDPRVQPDPHQWEMELAFRLAD